MLAVLLTILVIAPVIWLIVNKYNPQLSIVFGGFALLLFAAALGTGGIDGSKTGFVLFDVFAVWTNAFKSVTGGLGMSIMLVGAYAMYMDHIGASKVLVGIATRPLEAMHAPYVVLMMTYVVGQFLNVFIPSASGLALLLMVTAYPILVRLGVSKLSATAVVASTACLDLGPASGNTVVAAKVAGMDVVDFFVQHQLVIGVITAIAIAITHYFVQKLGDAKARPADGDLTEDSEQHTMDINAPTYYALLPMIPLVLIFTFSKMVVTTIKVDIYNAIVISLIVVLLVEMIHRRNVREVMSSYKIYLERMGKQFAGVVSLIISGSVLAAGLKAIGSIDFLIDSAVAAGFPVLVLICICVVVIAAASILMGSGNAAFFSFADLVPGIAGKIGVSVVSVVIPMQLAAGISRTMSPITGAIVAAAGISGVSPFDVVKRTFLPMLVGLIVSTLMSYFLLS